MAEKEAGHVKKKEDVDTVGERDSLTLNGTQFPSASDALGGFSSAGIRITDEKTRLAKMNDEGSSSSFFYHVGEKLAETATSGTNGKDDLDRGALDPENLLASDEIESVEEIEAMRGRGSHGYDSNTGDLEEPKYPITFEEIKSDEEVIGALRKDRRGDGSECKDLVTCEETISIIENTGTVAEDNQGHDYGVEEGGLQHTYLTASGEKKSVIVALPNSSLADQAVYSSSESTAQHPGPDFSKVSNGVLPSGVKEAVNNPVTSHTHGKDSETGRDLNLNDNAIRDLNVLDEPFEVKYVASSVSSSEQSDWVTPPLIKDWNISPSNTEEHNEHDEEFFQVSLQDPQGKSTASTTPSLLERISFGAFGQDKEAGSPRKSTEKQSSNVENIDGSRDITSPFSSHADRDTTNSSISDKSPIFSSLDASSLPSPLGSPLLHKGKAILPNASAELLHLIDSAIQGSDPNSLDKLRSIVIEEEQLDKETVTYNTSNLVVEILLAKMGASEGQYEEKGDTSPRMMLSVGAALAAGKLIPWLPSRDASQNEPSPRTRMVRGLAFILMSCTRNRSMCSAAGLLRVLIAAAQIIFTRNRAESSVLLNEKWDAKPLLELLTILGSHCLTGSDLQAWLKAIADVISDGKSLALLLPLERALIGEETRGPSHTFEFDGESSGLLGPGESKWPFINGYAFATWLYIESFADTVHAATTAAAIAAAAVAKSGKSSAMSAAAAASALAGEGTAHMPRLFSFLSADNQGLEAYFHSQFLVVESASSKGKKASLHFTYNFKPRHWYFIGIEHVHRQSILGKAESEVKLYVDGHLCDSRPFEFPRVTKPLAFCCIGTNPPPTMAGLQRRRRLCPLFAEMGPVYIFKEPIGEEKMARLAARGGDVVPAFGFGAGLPSFSLNEVAMMAAEDSVSLDMELESSLHLLYHPKLLVGHSCPDASPAGTAGTHRRPAEVLGHVHIAARTRPIETIWAAGEGGPLSLLPLAIGVVDKDTMEPTMENPHVSSRAAVLAAPILRIISLSLQHPGNAEELLRGHAPQLLTQILAHLLCVPVSEQHSSIIERPDARNEEIVAAVVLLAQAPKFNDNLKVPLFSKLLLDLKLWSRCSYGLQKKLLSSLADMVFTEAAIMREANALQMLLDGMRRCYWIVPERDSLHLFADGTLPRPVGEINALIDELLVVVELLLGTSQGAVASTDVQVLVKFLLDCPQPNQIARVLRLLYRLVVQPNTSRAAIFAENFLYYGGMEMLLTLLQREYESGETPNYAPYLEKEKEDGSSDRNEESLSIVGANEVNGDLDTNGSQSGGVSTVPPKVSHNISRSESLDPGGRFAGVVSGRNLGGIGLSITADSAKNNFRNIDSWDGIVVGIIGLIAALISGEHLKLASMASLMWSANAPLIPSTATLGEHVPNTNIDYSIWLLYALQKAFQAAPKRLLTNSVYEALLAGAVRSEAGTLSSEVHLNLYDSFHSFEQTQLLAVLFRVLPFGPKALEIRALQDILFLACTHSENRAILTAMPEWPEWLLETLMSNYECMKTSSAKLPEGSGGVAEIEDLVYNFLMIILEHSLRQKDGWKDVESTIHCAEWLAMIGGSSTGEQRQRREESLPLIKRKLLSGLLDFASAELQLQTQMVAAAAAGVVAGGLSPRAAKAEADVAAYLSMSLAENAIVLLMLVEDHLRLQCQIFNPSLLSAPASGPASPRAFMASQSLLGLSRTSSDGAEVIGSRRFSTTSDGGGVSLDVLAAMADSNGQISASVMERLTEAAAAEPYESVRCAFISYGSCGRDLGEGWKRRSHLWYGVGLPSKGIVFGGGGSGWDSWKSAIEKDENGNWIELTLVEKSIVMLQALLLDASGVAAGSSGFGYGGGAGTGTGGMHILQQLLDSDQPFFTMLRMVLLSMREEDKGVSNSSPSLDSRSDIEISSKLSRVDSFSTVAGHVAALQNRRTKASLLWCVLAPLLSMPLTESRRQRVLVAACIMYSEVWHAVSTDKKLLRKNYLELIVPPFATLLRRWRPLLSGMHELTDADGQSPLALEDRALAIDAHPLEAAAAMVTPEWAAAFASPPAAMALAMAAAGAGGGDINASKGSQRREHPVFERKTSRLRTFTSFQKLPESPPGKVTPTPKDKAGARAAALAAARDQERAAKIGSGRGLGAVAMASSVQRRTSSDRDRARRWGILESMHTAWIDCCSMSTGPGQDIRDTDGNPASLKLFLSLSEMMETARSLQHMEVRRCMLLSVAEKNDKMLGIHAWRQLLRRLLETGTLIGIVSCDLLGSQKVFWKLDPVENSMRMRKRLKRNYKGIDHHGAAADYLEVKTDSKNSKSVTEESDLTSISTSIHTVEAAKLLPEQVFEELGDDETLPNDIGNSEDRREERDYQHRLSTSSKQSSSDDQASMGLPTGPASAISGNSHVEVIEPHEKLLLEIPAAMVQPLRVSSGVFHVTSRRIYFVFDSNEYDSPENSVQKKEGKGRVWPMSALREVYSRRYLLRRSALELFMVDRSNYFFNFGTADGRRKACKALMQARPPFLKNVYAGTQKPEHLLKRTQLTERWARWEISNFEYLMQLNTLAGRSYNDITQYPVFPWVLSDYSSETLELDNPAIYRDLSKPVGALNTSRLDKILERYENFDDPVIPKFHYGSHYSSAGTVLYYLLRVEPFTTLSIQLQGGKFDHADRLFGDLGATWNGVLEDMSDVKELVPELFYSPEMLMNINNINLGKTQKGEQIGDVKLPPWAKDPFDFIHKHRAALESQHVSEHLNEWIDLIFGYKQRGKDAVTANNVFFYMTYEGAVDIDKITDPVIREGTQDQIAYFGQTPSQLLTLPHIKRMPLEEILHMQTIFRNPSAIQCYTVPSPERCNVPAGAICTTNETVITVDMKSPTCSVAVHKWQPHTPDGHGLPFHFQHAKPSPSSAGGALSRMFNRQSGVSSGEWRYPQVVACIASGVKNNHIVAITPDGYLLTGGHADNSLKLIAAESAKTMETGWGHCAPITCLSLSPDGSICLTGSRDSTAMLWRIHSRAIPNSDPGLMVTANSTAPSSVTDKLDNNVHAEAKRTRIEGPLHVLRGHSDDLSCCCVNADLDIAVTCSQTGRVLLHSITRGRLIRSLDTENVDLVGLSSEGILIIWNKTNRSLSTVNINGIFLTSIQLSPADGDITSIAVSADGQSAVIGTSCAKHQPPDSSWYVQQSDTSNELLQKSSDDLLVTVSPSGTMTMKHEGRREAASELQPSPTIMLLTVHNLQVMHKIKLHPGQDITALTLNNDSTNLVVSTANGELLVYTDPTLSIKVVDKMLRLGWQGAGLSVHL